MRSSRAPPTASVARSPSASPPRPRSWQRWTSSTVPELGSAVHGIEWDLSRTDTLDDLIVAAEAAIGPIDVLVNNAGIFEAALAVDLTLASYRRVLDVNLHAPVFLASRAARGMSERGYGRIVNITSIHGRFGEETALAYDVAKGGLEQATRTLAIELSRHGVLVNAVAPGFVPTRMSIVDGRTSSRASGLRTSTSSTASSRCGATRCRRRSPSTSRGSRASATRT